MKSTWKCKNDEISNYLNRTEKQTKFLLSELIDFSIIFYMYHYYLELTEHSGNEASFEKFDEQRRHLVGLTSDLSRLTFKKCLQETTGRSNI